MKINKDIVSLLWIAIYYYQVSKLFKLKKNNKNCEFCKFYVAEKREVRKHTSGEHGTLFMLCTRSLNKCPTKKQIEFLHIFLFNCTFTSIAYN